MSKDKDLSRIRSDSIWNSLPPERRATFEGWLFEEHVSYATARERARTEWGVEGSLSSVGKYARRVARRRAVTDLEELTAASTEVDGAEGKLARLKGSAMKLVGMQLLEKALMRGDIKELAALSRVLTQVEDREIQRGRLELAREKFEFKAAEAALKEAPALNRIQQEKQKRKDAEIVEARLAIFGKPPPGYKDPCSIRNSGNQERKAEDDDEDDYEHDSKRGPIVERVRPHPSPLPQEREKNAGARGSGTGVERGSVVRWPGGESGKPEGQGIKNGDTTQGSNDHRRMTKESSMPKPQRNDECLNPNDERMSKSQCVMSADEQAVVADGVGPKGMTSEPPDVGCYVNDGNGGHSGRATRVVDGTIPYEQEQRAVRKDG